MCVCPYLEFSLIMWWKTSLKKFQKLICVYPERKGRHSHHWSFYLILFLIRFGIFIDTISFFFSTLPPFFFWTEHQCDFAGSSLDKCMYACIVPPNDSPYSSCPNVYFHVPVCTLPPTVPSSCLAEHRQHGSNREMRSQAGKEKVTTHKLKYFSLEKWHNGQLLSVFFLALKEIFNWKRFEILNYHLLNQLTVVLFNLDAHRHRGEFLEHVLQQSKLPVHAGAVAACTYIHKHTHMRTRKHLTLRVLISYFFTDALITGSGTHLRKTSPPVSLYKEASPNRAHQRESAWNNLLEFYADTLWYSAQLMSSLGS